MPERAYTWRPIEDLAEEDLAGGSGELAALDETWQDLKSELAADQIERFHERLNREWAIETGIIENLYTLDRGTTALLIEHGIDASLIAHGETDGAPEHVAAIIRDQQSAVDWLFSVVKQERELTTGFIKELHALMTGKQEFADGVDQFGQPARVKLRHGEYKIRSNNPTRPNGAIHEYCPHEQVASEMDSLIELHREHAASGVAPEVEAAWLHHRFTQIHPFQDGNGRVARALASLVLIRAGWFPLVVTRDDRVDYLDALEEADDGDLGPLIRIFSSIQRRAFVRALSIADEVRREAVRVDQMIEAIGDIFAERDEALTPKFEGAKATTRGLWTDAKARFDDISEQISVRINASAIERRVFVDAGSDDDLTRRTWNRYQIVETARRFDYSPNLREFHYWVRLGFITENGRSEILLSFHAIGPVFRGLVGAQACFYRREDAADDIENRILELQPVSDDLFQINYKEPLPSVADRFTPWLEQSILRGLDQWRRSE